MVTGQLGETRWTRIAALVGLIAVSIPLPFGIDRALITAFQAIAASWTSGALDTFAVLHRLEGSMLNSRFFTMPMNRVSGGMDSFFILLGLATFFLSLRRHGYVATILLLLSVPVWSIIYSTLVQTSLGIYGSYLTVPTLDLPFGITRAVTFIVVVICFILFEIALLALTRPAKWSNLEDADWLLEENELAKFPVAAASNADATAKFGLLPLAGVLFLCGLLSAGLIATNLEAATGRSGKGVASLEAIAKPDVLPNEVAGWRRVQFETSIVNAQDGGLAAKVQWRYNRGLESVDFVVTSQELEFGGLRGRSGWKAQESTLGSVATPFLITELRNAESEQAFLITANIDPRGQVSPRPLSYDKSVSPWRSIFVKLSDESKTELDSRGNLITEAYYATIAPQNRIDASVVELATALLNAVSQGVKEPFAPASTDATQESQSK